MTLKRFEYEEPYHTEIHFRASNGLFMGHLGYYCGIQDLIDVGEKLGKFPTVLDDQFVYEFGSEDPKSHSAYYFYFHAFVVDRVGHCALHIRINKNGSPPYNGIADFSIRTNPSDLATLGDLFLKLSRFELKEFTWRPNSSRT